MKQRSDLKILLLQIREDEETMLEEFYQFVQFSELQEHQVDKLNTYDTAEFEPEIIDDYDALYIGGSSDASVLNTEEYHFVEDCKRLVQYCYQNDVPVFASCFGFQIATEAMGGKVILDKENKEFGIYQVELNKRASSDPLLHDYPHYIWTVSGHQERASKLPTDAILLGASHDCPYHIFTFKNKPFYAFQFHPEVDRSGFITRITRYRERYLDDSLALQKIIDASIHETPYATALPKLFIDRIVMPSLMKRQPAA